MQHTALEGPFKLGEFQIRPDLNEIEGPGGVVRINPKAMDVLLALARHAQELRSKQELLDAVWPDLYVGDDVLSTAIWELRRAFGDSARSPRFIQTVSRKGYRLMLTPVVASPAEFSAPAPAPVLPVKKSGLIAILPLLAIVAIVVGVLAVGPGSQRTPSDEIRSLAVLPFEHLSEDDRDRHFAAGLTDTLITAIAKIEGLRVVSRTTSQRYHDHGGSITDIAAELGVDAIVEGTVARSGDRILLNAQLIDARNEDHIWAETYERRFSDLLDLQVEVARSIGAAISLRLEHDELEPAGVPTADRGGAEDSLLRWRFQTGGEVDSMPVVADTGVVVFGSRDGWLYAVQVADGSELWRLKLGSEIVAAPLLAEDVVVATVRAGIVSSIAVDSGEERWRYQVGGEVECGLVGGPGIVVAGEQGGRVAALAATSGRELWVWRDSAGVESLTMAEGCVIVFTFDGTVVALDAVEGEELWRTHVDEYLVGEAGVADGEVFVPQPSGWVVSLDLATGAELWRAPQTSPSTPVVWRDRVFAGGEGAELRAFDRSSGSELWRFDALAGTTRPRVSDDLVFIGSRDDNLYALDAWSGALQWRVEMRTWVTTPGLVVDSAVIFGSFDGSVLCLELPSTPGVVIRESEAFRAVPARADERRRSWEIVSEGKVARRPRLRWRKPLGGHVLHSPAFADERLVAAAGSALVTLDLDSGDEVWRQHLPGENGTAPVLYGDPDAERVVIGTRDGSMLAFAVETGEEVWRFSTGGAVISTPEFREGRVFFGSRDGFMYALDAEIGEEIWRRQLDTIHAAPLLVGQEIWIPSRNDTLWVLSVDDGRVLRSYPTADWVVADPVTDGSQIIVAACDGTVSSRSLEDGRQLWEVTTRGEIWFRPLLSGGQYFFGSADRHVYAIDAATGRETWRRHTGNRVLSSVVGWQGWVVAGSHDRCLHALRQSDGVRQWRLVTTGIVGNPSARGNLLAVGSFDGYLYLLEL